MAYTAWPTGVVVSDPIVRPELALYGTHYDYMGVGGWVSVPNLADMYLIPNHPQIINVDGISSGQRKLGMVIKVTDLDTYYEFDIANYNSLTVAQQLLAFADNVNFKVKQFGNSNTVNAADVVGLSSLLDKKVDKVSIVDLPSNDSTMVISAKGLQDAITYSIAATGVTVGGIPANTAILNKTVKEILDMIFAAPFQSGDSTLSLSVNNQDPSYSSGTREFGNTDLAVTLTWTVDRRTNAIPYISVDATVITPSQGLLLTGLPYTSQSGTQSRNIGPEGTGVQFFTMIVKDSVNSLLNSNSNLVGWYYRRYWGTSAIAPADLKVGLANGSTQIYGLSGFANQQGTTRSLNNNYNCSGGKYIYYLYPKLNGAGINTGKGFDQITGGVLNGVNTFSSFSCDSVMLLDRFNIAREYYIFYTGYQTGSSVNINVT